ncbi:MAG TPA: TlpA disulfide reductase family protein [Gemmataceae bacterium]|jgi:thiol-disulfide isomerase/thioredoxin|nr:TlpA disulfide reductase family protein [Gemmataceae bacterium]
MPRPYRHRLVAALLAFVVAGCGAAPDMPGASDRQTSTSTPGAQSPARSSKSVTTYSTRCLADPPGDGEETEPALAEEVQLKVVKYDQWAAAVAAQRGKIVVMDVWANYCAPCKKEFPNLVRLHQRYAKDGVVCVSVTVDEPKDKDAALAFLRKKGASFPNFLMDENAAVWQEKWNMNGVPAVFVFGRDGTQAGKFDADDPDKQFTYADVEKLVQKLVQDQGR